MNRPLITIIIPAYNGEKFIDLSLHSLLNDTLEKEGVFPYYEIFIINDGSKDNTKEKAESIAAEWNKKIGWEIVKIINKENGQYGSVINKGISIANGKYIKVLDVDDTFDVKSFVDIIQIMKGMSQDVDVIFTDFSFEKALNNHQIRYSWSENFDAYEIKDLSGVVLPNKIVTMHSIIYRTNFLREINYSQVEGVYYSDSQYSVVPLSNAQTMFYINLPLYKYYIGRNEQSINIKMMVKNRLHQKKVFDSIIDDLLKLNFNSANQEKYAWAIAANMFEWQAMLISNDPAIKNKNKMIAKELKDLCLKLKENKSALRLVKKSALIKYLLITRSFAASSMIKFGAKLYAKYKLNVMADWD